MPPGMKQTLGPTMDYGLTLNLTLTTNPIPNLYPIHNPKL